MIGLPIMTSMLRAALFAAACGCGIAAVQAGQPPATEIANQVQARYDRVRDFSADFTQEAVSGVLRKKLVERGSVIVKKPGKMRWTYKAPEEKVFVSDGTKMYMHTPADNQVIVSPVTPADQATTAVLFLSGKGNLTRDFTVSLIPGAPAGSYALKLLPKLAERDYDWLQLVVDRSTYQIQGLTAADKQGTTSTFTFTNFKENVNPPDKTFQFAIPRGADVIQAGSPGR
jgi:outer membrane lipoprotein carrier protein